MERQTATDNETDRDKEKEIKRKRRCENERKGESERVVESHPGVHYLRWDEARHLQDETWSRDLHGRLWGSRERHRQ